MENFHSVVIFCAAKVRKRIDMDKKNTVFLM